MSRVNTNRVRNETVLPLGSRRTICKNPESVAVLPGVCRWISFLRLSFVNLPKSGVGLSNRLCSVRPADAFGNKMDVLTATSGFAPVNGLALYYEIHGSGRPLVLIHGGFGAIPLLGPIISDLAKSRRVIAIEVQGHGRTGDIDRPLTFEFLADDVAGILEFLGISQADVMGYSFGAAVGLHVAFAHPGVLRKLVVVTEPMKSDGWFPETLVGFAHLGPGSAAGLKQTPLYSTYASLAPDPTRWEALHDKYHNLLAPAYDWSDRVREMKTPTLLVFGDADAVRLSHPVEFFELLGGGQKDGGWDRSAVGQSRLAILPGATHYDNLSSLLLVPAVNQFLDEPAT